MPSRPAMEGELASPFELQCCGLTGCYERIPPGHVHTCPSSGLLALMAHVLRRVREFPRSGA